MAIDFPRSTYTAAEGVSAESWPASPSNGDTQTNGAGDNFTFNGTSSLWVLNTGRTLTLSGGATYSWDGEKWIAQSHIPFRYFGPQASDPTGMSASDEGDLYYNTVENEMRVYNGSSWDTITSVGDFNILTLSASSTAAPVGGTASFNGTATRFQLSETPNVAQQLLISINGVVQEPQAGTSPTVGFAVSGSDIIFAAAPATGSAFFGVQMGATVNIGTPSDNTVTNAKVATNAAIAGTKISPNFGSQDIVTTGDVGIGTSSPSQKLHISNNAALQILLERTGGNAGSCVVGNEGNHLRLQNNVDGVEFRTGSTPSQKMLINSTGKLLVGHSSSRQVGDRTHFVQVENTGLSDGGFSVVRNRNDEHSTSITVAKTRGSAVGANTIVSDNDFIGEFAFAAADGTDCVTRTARIVSQVEGSPAANNVPGDLQFWTNSGASSPTLQMRIASSGFVGIGSTNPTAKLQITGADTSARGQLTIAGSSGGSGVDARLTFYRGTDFIGHISGQSDHINISTESGHHIEFSPAGTERMRINSAGKLFLNNSAEHGTNARNSWYSFLHINGNSYADTADGRITLTSDATLSGTAALGSIYFADLNGGDRAAIRGHQDGAGNSSDNFPGRLSFWTNSGTSNATEKMRIDSAGHVGIGTSSPQTLLDCQGTGSQTIRSRTNDTSGNAVGILRAEYAGGGGGTNTNVELRAGDGYSYLLNTTNAPMLFGVNTTERMRIDSSGNVGIGTTSPGARLHVSTTGAANGSTTDTLILNNDNSNTGDNLRTRLRFSRSGNSSSNVYTALDSIRVGTHDTDFAISTNNGGTLSEHIRLHSNGRVGLGTNGTGAAGTGVDVTVRMTPATSTYGVYSSNFITDSTSTPAGYAFYGHMGGTPPTGGSHYGVYGNVDTNSSRASGGVLGYSINNSVYGIVAYWSTAAYYSFYGNGAVYATGGFSSSDARLKDIVSDGIGTGILDKVCKLQAKKFTWKDNTQQRRGCENVLIGLLAQDVQIDFPEVVDSVKQPKITGANPETLNEQIGDNLAIDYGKLVPVLVEALKEAKERIETLEAEVAALKSN